MCARDYLHNGISLRGKRIANIAPNGGNDAPLHWRVSEELGVSNDVVSVAPAAGAVDECAYFVQHGCGFKPIRVFRRQTMNGLETLKKLHGEVANTPREYQIGFVMLHNAEQGIVAFLFDALFNGGALAIVGEHLCQKPIP